MHIGPFFLQSRFTALHKLIEEVKPNLVVSSGDQTRRAKKKQFIKAKKLLDSLKIQWTAVPGNHDIPMYRVWERFFFPRYKYKKFFLSYTEPNLSYDNLEISGIDTTKSFTKDRGIYRKSSLRRLNQLWKTEKKGLRIVVAHHPPVSPPGFKKIYTTNSQAAIKTMASLGVDLMICGHYHVTYNTTSHQVILHEGEPFPIFAIGTVSCARGRGGEKKSNSCAVIIVKEEKTIEIIVYRWNKNETRFKKWYSLHYKR